MPRVSGHLTVKQGKRGAVWYARYRSADGRQVQKRIGRVWTTRGRPPEDAYTKSGAEEALQQLLSMERLGGGTTRRTGVTFGDACDEWIRYSREERRVKESTLEEYQSVVRTHLLPTFGADRRLDAITTQSIEHWKATAIADGRLSDRSINKILTNLSGIFGRAQRKWRLPTNPVAEVERIRERRDDEKIDFYSPEEVWALVRASESDQDGTLFLTAAFAGLRMGELLALTWRDVDFARSRIHVRRAVRNNRVGLPKGGKVRSVPMQPDVAEALARLSGRGWFVAEDDLVFPGARSAEYFARVMNAEDYAPEQDEVIVASYQDRSALRRRFVAATQRAELRPIRFHDLRHTFGTVAIQTVDIVRLQEWLGHADLKTTRVYLHYRQADDEAQLLADAFSVATPKPEAAAEEGIPA